ncbi:ATP-binding response regulator [Arenibaculum pallidiluteum]|uniref:ATP-binding response regulator n=1 Tax=Arenibaculum pallidiluteum TaxID=2812559 RepID=UPI001A97AB14|nr:hybrid sensor histidine kinase/response regulator [Arenibaculum pallidiluteum]
MDANQEMRRLQAECDQALAAAEDARDEASRYAQENALLAAELAARTAELERLRAESERREAEARAALKAAVAQAGSVLAEQESAGILQEELRVTMEELQAANEELLNATESLERRVLERTAELRRSEERLRLAQHYADAGIWDWDIVADRVTWTEPYFALYGLSPATTTPSRDAWLQSIHPEDRPAAAAALKRCIDERTPDFVVEYRILHPERGIRWLLGRGRMEFDAKRRPVRLVGLNLDVTDRRRAEEEARAAREEAERANAAKSRLLAAASHDLRQPVMAAGLFMGLLRRRSDPAATEVLDLLQTSLDSLDRMLSSLLDMAKLEAGIVSPRLRAFPLSDILQRLMPEFEGMAQQNGLWFRIPDKPCVLHSDPLLVEQILRNLLSNAIKYTQEGGVTVDCATEGDRIRIDVIDTGPGIPDEELERIFGEFYQTGTSGQDHARGFGLGLATVDRVARLLGTQVRVSSAPGRGSVFSIALPASDSAEADAPAAQASAGGNLAGARVLLVEDDPAVLAAMRLMLHEWGMQVHAASSLAEVRPLLDALDVPPDIVIADYSLGRGKRGTEAVAMVRERWPVPAVIVTGDTSARRLAEAKRSGLLLVHKPMKPEALHELLGSLLASRAA